MNKEVHTMLSDSELQQLMEIVEGTYGDTRKDLQDALRDLILTSPRNTLATFLRGQLQGISRGDLMDPTIYDRAKTLITLLESR